MSEHWPDVPVLFLVFNRVQTTAQVFEAIREARPSRLFVAADGPRDDKPGEHEVCQTVRTIATAVDWDCELNTLFRDHNVGCGKAVSSAITWFFSQVEEGIILEDDCLPSPDFFRFCGELLEKYRDDNRIMHIGGNNLQVIRHIGSAYSYFFSNHNFIWGWATWRRAWNLYDYQMKHYQEIMRKRYHRNYFHSFDERNYYEYVLDLMYADLEHTTVWSYQWQFTRMLQAGLVIVPWRNLVINIGGGSDATHTKSQHDVLYNQTLESMIFPLKHPEFVMVDKKIDARIFNAVHTKLWSRIKQRIKRTVPKSLLALLKTLLAVGI